MTFEQMPSALESMQAELEELKKMVIALADQKPKGTPEPINGKELCRRLRISAPTLIAMRKRGEIPFYTVGGHCRYDWESVTSAIAENQKAPLNKSWG